MRLHTTSSPATSPRPDVNITGVEIGDYDREASDEALELERESVQGAAYRLAFRRETFHRRAEQFGVHRIRTARLGGRLVGIAAVALKAVEVRGKPEQAAFLFDLRVRPEVRGLGIGRLLGEDLLEWATPRSDLAYTYTMGDNQAARRVVLNFGMDVGGYAYFVRPTFFNQASPARLEPVSKEEVHSEMRRSLDFDFYASPFSEGRTGAHVASWLLPGRDGLSGVSAWSMRGILEEVVLSLPPPLRAVRALLRSLPSRLTRCVRLPEDGEALRSLYLFDFFSSSPLDARDLLRAVAREARERGIDWLYLTFTPGDQLLAAAQADSPKLLSPIVPYRMVARRSDGSDLQRFRHLYVDPRDL